MIIRIKEFRKKFGLKQQDLSKLTGIGQATISDLESGKHSPDIWEAYDIAEALGCSVYDIFIKEKEK